MTAFTREIRISPGYDYRDEPDDRRGAAGASLLLILRGPAGAITCAFDTGWMTAPLTGRFIPGQAQARADQPGTDHTTADLFPSARYVGTHCPSPGIGREPQGDCDIIGGPCWGDGSYSISDSVLQALVAGGSDAAFARLEELYRDWIPGYFESEKL